MAEIVLRVRLISGEHLDVAYDEGGAATGEVVEHVILTLAEEGGALRCRHGERLIVLYGRGVATLEVAPRGAVLLLATLPVCAGALQIRPVDAGGPAEAFENPDQTGRRVDLVRAGAVPGAGRRGVVPVMPALPEGDQRERPQIG